MPEPIHRRPAERNFKLLCRGGAPYGAGTSAQHVRVDHGRRDSRGRRAALLFVRSRLLELGTSTASAGGGQCGRRRQRGPFYHERSNLDMTC